jgi:hypothetical protein
VLEVDALGVREGLIEVMGSSASALSKLGEQNSADELIGDDIVRRLFSLQFPRAGEA